MRCLTKLHCSSLIFLALFVWFVLLLDVFHRDTITVVVSTEHLPQQLNTKIDDRVYPLPPYFLEGWKGYVRPGQTRYYSGWLSRRYFTLGFIDGDFNNPWTSKPKEENKVHWRSDARGHSQYIEPQINPELEMIVELDDAMKTVYTAQDQLIAIELGCACGPQLGTVAAINRRSRNLTMKLIGVEAEPKKLEMFHLNMKDNAVEPSEYVLKHGAISIDNNPINFTFNSGDGASDYGSHVVIDKLANILTKGDRKIVVQVPSYTVCDILRDEAYVDYLHMDIQGMELYVLQQHIHCLNEKVRIMHIGIHGYAIYARTIEILLNNGWILKHFTPGVTANPMNVNVFPTKFGERYSQDGLISAINSRFSYFKLFSVLLEN